MLQVMLSFVFVSLEGDWRESVFSGHGANLSQKHAESGRAHLGWTWTPADKPYSVFFLLDQVKDK